MFFGNKNMAGKYPGLFITDYQASYWLVKYKMIKNSYKNDKSFPKFA